MISTESTTLDILGIPCAPRIRKAVKRAGEAAAASPQLASAAVRRMGKSAAGSADQAQTISLSKAAAADPKVSDKTVDATSSLTAQRTADHKARVARDSRPSVRGSKMGTKALATSKATKGRPAVPATKASLVIDKLRTTKGATIDVLMEATGWQAHSVRGFLLAIVRKKLEFNLISEIGKEGVRRHRIAAAGESA